MSAIYRNRMEGVTRNSDAARDLWLEAAAALADGDTAKAEELNLAAIECDQLAIGFAEGKFDDVCITV